MLGIDIPNNVIEINPVFGWSRRRVDDVEERIRIIFSQHFIPATPDLNHHKTHNLYMFLKCFLLFPAEAIIRLIINVCFQYIDNFQFSKLLIELYETLENTFIGNSLGSFLKLWSSPGSYKPEIDKTDINIPDDVMTAFEREIIKKSGWSGNHEPLKEYKIYLKSDNHI